MTPKETSWKQGARQPLVSGRRAASSRRSLDHEGGLEGHGPGHVVEIGRGRHHRLVDLGELLFGAATLDADDVAQILVARPQGGIDSEETTEVDLTIGLAELAAQRGYSHSRFELIKSDVLKNLHRHDLTIELVARARGLSPRQAQRFFACSGTTFTEFVLTQRLSLAHRLLNEPRFRNRKITDVAYTAGFGDLSYFNREFRRRFGDTPSAIRNGNISRTAPPLSPGYSAQSSS
jgi:AraC-like DNA-binding protein